jgi:hypothetical protein
MWWRLAQSRRILPWIAVSVAEFALDLERAGRRGDLVRDDAIDEDQRVAAG